MLDPSTLDRPLAGIDTAYFLAHALGAGQDFEKVEREMTTNFVAAAKKAGVRRIIYLGGLGAGSDLSPHLKSRHEVGEILRSSGILTIEFRASIIIGSGSLSFELLRSLVEKLPVMVTPKWARSLAQPIAIGDVLSYLLSALTMDLPESEIFEIGGPDQVAYTDLMREYARQRSLKRVIVPVPVLTPRLSSLWLGLVTPVYARIGRKLIDSLRHDTLVTDFRARDVFSLKPIGYADAISRALSNEDRAVAETRWYDALSSSGLRRSWGGAVFGTRIIDVRNREVAVPPERAFKPIREIGGKRGWYFANFLWRLRGLIDLLLGGVGTRRYRANPSTVRIGDPIDFWRVEGFEDNKLLRLRAEMKLPGRAWLQFEVSEAPGGGSVITQTAIFDPLGLSGLLYWYALYPMHTVIFHGMLNRIVRAALP